MYALRPGWSSGPWQRLSSPRAAGGQWPPHRSRSCASTRSVTVPLTWPRATRSNCSPLASTSTTRAKGSSARMLRSLVPPGLTARSPSEGTARRAAQPSRASNGLSHLATSTLPPAM
eukprot:scaffold97444_cov80-Phaeocystis_antarctica.AAC.3